MQTAELKGEIHTRLENARQMLDESKIESKEPQSTEYYQAQTELMTYTGGNAQEIIDKLSKLETLERTCSNLLAYPDKRIIPWTEWQDLRTALGLEE